MRKVFFYSVLALCFFSCSPSGSGATDKDSTTRMPSANTPAGKDSGMNSTNNINNSATDVKNGPNTGGSNMNGNGTATKNGADTTQMNKMKN